METATSGVKETAAQQLVIAHIGRPVVRPQAGPFDHPDQSFAWPTRATAPR
jgi:hypothetical protein